MPEARCGLARRPSEAIGRGSGGPRLAALATARLEAHHRMDVNTDGGVSGDSPKRMDRSNDHHDGHCSLESCVFNGLQLAQCVIT
jgi:hypothetical protein